MMSDAVFQLASRVETLRMSVACNRLFLSLVPPGADPKTEALVSREEVELEQALADLATLEAA